MTELNASAEHAEDLKAFVVSFRCHSHIYVPWGHCFKLPEFPTADGQMQFAIMSEFGKHSSGLAFPKHLILQTAVYARTMKDAHLAAISGATNAASWLAFLHNAHIEAPLRWFSYETKDTQEWRRIGQIEYESSPPQFIHQTRAYQPDLTEKFFLSYGPGDATPKEWSRVARAIGLYGKALENWAQWRATFAAQYLFMAAETLTKLARRRYFAQEQTTEEALLKPYIDKLREGAPVIPAGASPEDAAIILEVYDRVGLPGFILDTAKNKLNAEIRRKTIFRESPATHNALNRATNGMEHGFDDVGITHRLVLPHVDQAAACVRKWILEQTVRDEALIPLLLTGECGTPLRTGKYSLVVGAEFRSTNSFATPAAAAPPFRLTAVPGAPAPTAGSLMGPAVELRAVVPHFYVPLPTFKAETELRAETYEKFYGTDE
jgi:hypothetical protein